MLSNVKISMEVLNMKVLKTAGIVIVSLLMAVPAFTAGTGETKTTVNVEQKKTNKSFIKIQTAMRETLDSLVDAYVSKNTIRFMSFVAEDFAGDDMILNRMIRSDFSKFIDMDLKYTFNNVTPDSSNKNISVAVTFTRSYTDIKTTKRINKTGSTVLIFRMVDDMPKLVAMRRPFMFGVGK